jgi:hypothetical protein
LNFYFKAQIAVRGEISKTDFGMDTTGKKNRGRPGKTWMEGVKAVMTTRYLEPNK